MHPAFEKYTASLDDKLQELLSMAAVTMAKPLMNAPSGGVYLFTENGKHLYVGRTKRKISKRVRGHVSTAKDCPFAFRLARETVGKTVADYSGDHTRDKLLADPAFAHAYAAAKDRLREMDVRWVAEDDPIRQALLEIYVSVVLQTPYNDFDTH